jgi:hypothetical protein
LDALNLVFGCQRPTGPNLGSFAFFAVLLGDPCGLGFAPAPDSKGLTAKNSQPFYNIRYNDYI